MTKITVGFIGLGTMGGPMALNVVKKGYALTVHDARSGTAEPHIAAGATWAASIGELAARADVVLTSLPGPPEVHAVAGALLPDMRPGAAWFDLSTNSPTQMRALHAQFAERGVAVLDAPVSGGIKGARLGKLAIWVGGDQKVFDRHRPVLAALADEIAHVGAIGAGSIAKLVHNCAGYAMQLALAEVFTMGVKAGLEPLPLWSAIRQGALGRQRSFDRIGERFLTGIYEPPNFALALAHKDVKLATELAREMSVPMRLAELTLAEMTEAINRGWGRRDARTYLLLQQERAGVEMQVPPDQIEAVLKRQG